jgi:hypothetical protein
VFKFFSSFRSQRALEGLAIALVVMVSTPSLAREILTTESVLDKTFSGKSLKDPNRVLNEIVGQFPETKTDLGFIPSIGAMLDSVFDSPAGFITDTPFIKGASFANRPSGPSVDFYVLYNQSHIAFVGNAMGYSERHDVFRVSLDVIPNGSRELIIRDYKIHSCKRKDRPLTPIAEVKIFEAGQMNALRNEIKGNSSGIRGSVWSDDARRNSTANFKETMKLYAIHLSDEEAKAIQVDLNHYLEFRDYFFNKTGVLPKDVVCEEPTDPKDTWVSLK